MAVFVVLLVLHVSGWVVLITVTVVALRRRRARSRARTPAAAGCPDHPRSRGDTATSAVSGP
ncbi:MAG: hypothetical protein GEU83_07180 [Pseudonocardiaceae bacterium]|nr:hypothetical protein [Pseudonocardiaceae bacterium]